MKLSRSAGYAITALLELADHPSKTPVSSHQLATKGAMPERFLLQVLRSLVNHGILRSTRGVVGGYSLVRPLEEITLLQVIEVTDGPVAPVLPQVEAIPTAVRERLAEALGEVAAATSAHLSSVTLADLKPGYCANQQECQE